LEPAKITLVTVWLHLIAAVPLAAVTATVAGERRQLFRGEPWAIFVYPLCVVGILDSYWVLYWTRREMVVVVLGIVLVMRSVYRAATAPQPDAGHTTLPRVS
jgi:hypothetical protein